MGDISNKKFEIVPTEQFLKDFIVLLSMPSEKIELFADVVNSDDGYGISKEVKLTKLLKDLDLTAEQFQQIYNVSKHIFDQIEKNDSNFMELYQELKEINKIQKLSGLSQKKRALKKLFTISPKFKEKEKVSPYKKGLQYHLFSITSTHEMRAVFEEGKNSKKRLIGFYPIATTKLIAKNDKDEIKSLIFAANEKNLSFLIENLKESRDNLLLMKSNLTKHKVKVLEEIE